jgi:uncharacterized protein (DUF427 family)
VEPPAARLEPTPRRVRVRADDAWVADSKRALLLSRYGPGILPTYCFPPDDVRTDLLDSLGDAAFQLQDLAPPLDAANRLWTFTWDGRVSWFEEAEEVFVHARDPRHRVDVVRSDRHVRVEIAGRVVAESGTPHALFETTLPTRWYLPPHDVQWDLLEPSDTVTRCPFKGTARHWSARVGGRLHPDVAWSYPDPIPECPRIAGLVSFYNEKVELTIDGEPVARPSTPWSL